MTDIVVDNGTRVTLHFSLELEDGTLVDSNFDSKPASFEVGDGSLLDGFEVELFGLKAGDKKTVNVLPEAGFGQHNPQNIHVMDRKVFSDETELEKGLMLSFEDPGQGELPGVVVDFDEHKVSVDFNHPLAGRTIVFTAEIVAVEPVTTH